MTITIEDTDDINLQQNSFNNNKNTKYNNFQYTLIENLPLRSINREAWENYKEQINKIMEKEP